VEQGARMRDVEAMMGTEQVGTPPLQLLRYFELDVTLGALGLVQLPDYVGSTLRGALGMALKTTLCTNHDRAACDKSCAWPRTCGYGLLMETEIPQDAPDRLKASKYAPHPYVMTPPAQGGALFPGDELTFRIRLFGASMHHVISLVGGFAQMARAGMGKGRAQLALARLVDAPSKAVVYAGDGEPPRTELLTPLKLGLEATPGDAEREDAQLILLTPLQLERGGRMIERLTAADVLYACADRLALLAACHGLPGAELPDARAVADRARALGIEVQRDTTNRMALERYSNRQERKHGLDGLVGSLSLVGPLAEFAPLLRAASVTHIGKKTAFGFGAVHVFGV
jgi:hypothetical protein